MGFFRQLKALVSKNITLKKRLWKQTIWEFIAPVVICFFFGYFQDKDSTSLQSNSK